MHIALQVSWPLGGINIAQGFSARDNRVDVFVHCPFTWQFAFFKNRGGWAFGLASAAVDAFIRVDGDRIFAFVKTVNGANRDAIGVFAFNAWIGNDKRHLKLLEGVGNALFILSTSGTARKAVDAKIVNRQSPGMATNSTVTVLALPRRVGLAAIYCCIGALFVAPAGCQRGATEGAWKQTAMGRDLDRICNVMKYSGAEQDGPENYAFLTAQWLGQNLESGEGRDFLVEIAQLAAGKKGAALEAKALQVGVTECPTVALWRAPGAVAQ